MSELWRCAIDDELLKEETLRLPTSSQMARGGCCWSGLGPLSRKNKKRIAPAIQITQPTDPQGQFAFLLAPPSSPASHQNSMVPSSAQSPYYPPTCPVPPGGGSRIPLETQSNMFTVGPYAHETALVSPPVFSTFTTAPSTAPFTPPPELAAQFTTPSSPDVPFAKLLGSSFSEQRAGKREPEPPYSASPFASPDYYQQDQNQQEDLQVAYQLYPGSPLGRMISPAGTTGASTPLGGGGGTTGTTTPHPETDNPTPLTVLPAVVSILPNLEHQVAEGLHQRSILDSQCGPGEPLSDSYRERNGSFDGNSRFMGALLHDRDGFDSNSNSYGHERYSGSLSGLNEVLEGQHNKYTKLKQDNKQPRHTALESQEEFQDDDLLELPMLSGTEGSQCDSRPSRSPSNSSRFQSKVGSKAGSKVGSKAGSKVGSKAGSKGGSKTGSDSLKEWDHSEENLLEYALSLLEGSNGNRQGTIGWAPLDTSLSRVSEASSHPSSGPENWTEESRANSLMVNSSHICDQIGKCSTDVAQESNAAGASEVPEETHTPAEHRDRDPGCCSRCESLVSQCEQLSLALKEAERKQLEKERLAEEREQQIRHLTQLLQSGGLKKFVGDFSRSGNQVGKDNKVEDTL